ncbi:MAG: GDP-mannose 4,6-dehydratase [Endomicrobium sp.]|jgi:nucleoside-diphosphate-sugar epimerase|nr:GDP-mannose 4,6-dehydratase [Endomicrobium sp.]
MSILVTGAAGFIGSKVCELLAKIGKDVVGLDNLNNSYDIRMKEHRLQYLKKIKNIQFYRVDIEIKKDIEKIINIYNIESIINLAARAGVRYSMKNPFVYVSTNILGTLNLLEIARENKIQKFVLASTSSLYAGQKVPFAEDFAVNTPISPYAASKKAAEAMCYSYHYLYGIDVSILRYFTVYGPYGRPDMSIIRFIKWIDDEKPIKIFGDGSQSRDFTYVEDIAIGTLKSLEKIGFEVINLGSSKTYEINYMITLIEKNLNKKAKYDYKQFHKADIMSTLANINKAKKILKWTPKISLEHGIRKTVDWYLENKYWLKDINL